MSGIYAYVRCPSCGRVETEEWWLAFAGGSAALCSCGRCPVSEWMPFHLETPAGEPGHHGEPPPGSYPKDDDDPANWWKKG